jgi:hypothetical protein
MDKIQKEEKMNKHNENKDEEEIPKEEKCLMMENIPISSHMSKMRLFPLLYIISLCRLLPPSPLPVMKAQDFPPQNLLSGTLS